MFEVYVVFGHYDYEGEEMLGAFENEEQARVAMQEEIEKEDYHAVSLERYCGRNGVRLDYVRISADEEI